MTIQLDGDSLTLGQIHQCAYHNEPAVISERGWNNLIRSRQDLDAVIASKKSIYGINTGFGIFSEKLIPITQAQKLSRNLILSHAVGTGEPLALEIVRAAMLIRANTLAKGYSGITPEIVETLIEMLNKNVLPYIPSQGSLGSSGDLSLLAHMTLVLSRDEEDQDEFSGKAYVDGRLISGKQAMLTKGIERKVLGYKDGLALINGATFSCAVGALLAVIAEKLVDLADTITGMSMEALHGCSSALDERIHKVRGHSGQMISAKQIAQAINGSTLVDCEHKVQDAYSLRCAPQVHGAIRDTISNVKTIIETEANAATDNPLIFNDSDVISGGNFHGEPIGFGMDFLAIALAELGAISERRIFRLLDPCLSNGLPPMLVHDEDQSGLNSGLMMPHYTAVSLVLENQTLAHPDSVHSLPTSGEQEDHNANSMTAARHAWQVYQNIVKVLTIEAFTAAHAIDIRKSKQPGVVLGTGTNQLYQSIRNVCPYKNQDTLWSDELERLEQYFRTTLLS
ncbi:MAG: histidine ammonia-lyase [Anaerolineae bacterium]|jgi:histidine ammonia-lyase|nr:histidine ammonia-lyase [Anaerolineae bacterium]